mmetsp:Transcript_18066/g.49890  ORF Transcript_18066/g.49890 Transcript_18066/m.49890 type:complete len:136 (+) Transcript_18066:255-662(+)
MRIMNIFLQLWQIRTEPFQTCQWLNLFLHILFRNIRAPHSNMPINMVNNLVISKILDRQFKVRPATNIIKLKHGTTMTGEGELHFRSIAPFAESITECTHLKTSSAIFKNQMRGVLHLHPAWIVQLPPSPLHPLA